MSLSTTYDKKIKLRFLKVLFRVPEMVVRPINMCCCEEFSQRKIVLDITSS